jgi:hypothetical protein
MAMSKMTMAAASVVVLVAGSAAAPGRAADLDVSPRVAPSYVEPYCGPCGCLRTVYVRHRTLQTTYGAGFDPRNFDTQEPHYYFGPMRSYPRYFVDGVPVGGPLGACF